MATEFRINRQGRLVATHRPKLRSCWSFANNSSSPARKFGCGTGVPKSEIEERSGQASSR
jgi:hypothetical protein